jgi:MerR family copper efflux transcriptional regulator
MARVTDSEMWGARPGVPSRSGAGLTIGQVSKRTGIPAKTIRYYESIGLLPPPPRGENTYRRYSGADVNRLLLLRRIKLLGASLADAKDLLEGATDARCVDAQESLLSLVDERLSALDRQIEELRALREQVSDYRRTLTSCRTDDATAFADCPDMRCIGAPPDEDGACDASAADYSDTGQLPCCPAS